MTGQPVARPQAYAVVRPTRRDRLEFEVRQLKYATIDHLAADLWLIAFWIIWLAARNPSPER